MELIVKVRGATMAEILEGLDDAVGLISCGRTELRPQDDPEDRIDFMLVGAESNEVARWCPAGSSCTGMAFPGHPGHN